jgi:hypothetical protein
VPVPAPASAPASRGAGGADDRAGKAARLRLAIEDLIAAFGDRYPRGREYLQRLAAIESGRGRGSLGELHDEALLANPLLDMEGLLVVLGAKAGDPSNFHGAAHTGRAIAVVSPARGGQVKVLYEPKLTPEEMTQYKADKNAMKGLVGFIDLHFDGKKFLFSAATRNGYQVFEMNIDGTGLRQVSRDDLPHVDNYSPIYLPDGRICFLSTRMFQGVPCIGGAADISNLFSMNANGGDVRQLTYEQDHDWEPAVMNDGRVMYTRWEYTDSPHFHTRLVFSMNPDGTNQKPLFKSNVYWPNPIFFARPIPDHPSRFVGIATGHHGMTRTGTMYVLDPSVSNEPARAVVQRIPPDPLELHKSPRWLEESSLDGYSAPCQNHRRPYPLADAEGRGAGKYFLVPGGSVVDVFGNAVSLGAGGVENVPIGSRPRPRIIPDRTDRKRKDAQVYIMDVYRGGGLAGVPRGTVKKLRLFEYNYGHRNMASHDLIGPDGPWEPHRIWGTVPVEEDGSAYFTVPAMTPLAVQPLDGERHFQDNVAPRLPGQEHDAPGGLPASVLLACPLLHLGAQGGVEWPAGTVRDRRRLGRLILHGRAKVHRCRRQDLGVVINAGA